MLQERRVNSNIRAILTALFEECHNVVINPYMALSHSDGSGFVLLSCPKFVFLSFLVPGILVLFIIVLSV